MAWFLLRRRTKLFYSPGGSWQHCKEGVYTLECAGNNGCDWFGGGIGNARWAGTPLAPILKEAGVKPEGIKVVFFDSDESDAPVFDNQFYRFSRPAKRRWQMSDRQQNVCDTK